MYVETWKNVRDIFLSEKKRSCRTVYILVLVQNELYEHIYIHIDNICLCTKGYALNYWVITSGEKDREWMEEKVWLRKG